MRGAPLHVSFCRPLIPWPRCSFLYSRPPLLSSLHLPGTTRLVLACAGSYMFGIVGGFDCPSGIEPIDDEAACRTAAAAVNRSIAVVQRNYARGCSLDTNSGTVYFNANMQAFDYCGTCRLLCMGAPACMLGLRRARTQRPSCCMRDSIPHVPLRGEPPPPPRVGNLFDGRAASTRVCGSPRYYSTACLPADAA